MKFIKRSLAFSILFLAAAASGHAEILLVSFTGSINLIRQPGFWDGTVTNGTAFTASFEIDSNAPIYSNDGSRETYDSYQSNPGFIVNYTVGDYSFTSPAETYLTISKDSGASNGTSYEFFANIPDQEGLSSVHVEADLFFADTASLGGTAMSDLTVHPLNQFLSTSVIVTGIQFVPFTVVSAGGSVSSYSITVVPTPEPSTWALIGLGALLLPAARRFRAARA